LFDSRKLRHRVILQQPVQTRDSDTGAFVTTWDDVVTVWARIEPLSVREIIAAETEDSKISARITLRYRANISHEMRLYHQSKNKYYNIEGVLSDKNSGFDYLTVPASEGIRYQDGDEIAPVLLEAPVITGTLRVGEVLEVSTGVWANEPVSYTYQWYTDTEEIDGADESSYLLTDAEEGFFIYCVVTAVNNTGSVEATTGDYGPVVTNTLSAITNPDTMEPITNPDTGEEIVSP